MPKSHGLSLGLLLCAALPALARAQPVGSEFQVNTYTPGPQFNPSVSSAADGSFVVVWSNYYPFAAASIVGQRYDASGVPQGAEFPVTPAGPDLSPDVAADASANFVVVWERLTVGGDSAGVFAQRFDSLGNPQGGEFQVNSYTPNQSGRRVPSIASDPSGNFVVVWTSGNAQDGSGYGIFGQRFDASEAPLGGEFQVNSYTSGNQRSPDAAMDSDGSFVVVWHGSGPDGDPYDVFGRRYDATGAPQGNAFQVNSYITSTQYLPAVAFGSNGSFVVSWVSGNSQDGDRSGIFAQRYDGVGTPQGGEFQVNSYTTNYQRALQMAADASGNFVVAWTSYFAGQDGSGDGIFAKRFGAMGNGARL